MTNIIVIETKENLGLMQDVVEFILEKEKCSYTQININAAEEDTTHNVLSFSDLCIDLEQYTITKNQMMISMSCYEFRALAFLAEHSGRVFSKEQIYNAVYGDEKVVNVENAVYCLIRNIRRKLKNDKYIETVRGVGYKFRVPEE